MRQFTTIILGVAIIIALVATFLLSLLVDLTTGRLLIFFILELLLSFVIMLIILRIFIFRDINNIENTVYNWLEKTPPKAQPDHNFFFDPFKRIDQSIRFVGEEKQKELEELEKVSDFRKEFIANISHELKTPIFSAQGFVHTLLDGAVRDKNVRTKFLKKAAKSLDGLDLLVQDLLTLSQIEIGDIKMHFEYFDIVKLVNEVTEQLEDQAEKKDVEVIIEPRKSQILVFADYQRMHQVINNLLTNAIKYNKEKGKVKVTIKEEPQSVIVRVADTGEGIPEEHQARIFERFYRVEKSRSRRGGGTGLGLAIVKHILEGHKTSIQLSSKPGKGTVFSFKLAKGEEDLAEN